MYQKERQNKNIIKLWFFRIIFVADMAIMLIYAFLNYCISTFNPITDTLYDGLGRVIIPAPLIMRLIAVRNWRGLTWWIIDSVLEFILLCIAILTSNKTKKIKERLPD